MEEVKKARFLVFRNDISDFVVYFSLFSGLAKIISYQSFESRANRSVLFDEFNAIPYSKSILKEVGASKARKVTVAHNSDSICQYVSFFHEMGS